ncbi:hypothetical protein, partial [Alicyclobacillus sp.]|uniref:hypothetical protein n=1 Tax=Alicyclobacillus sp. TaxID=61169 RepID=UPI0025BB13EF
MSAVTLPSIPIKPAGLLKITLYAAAAMLWLGPVLGHLSEWYIGWPGDPQQFMWYLGWFWHALAAGENPFFTRQLNAPIGQSLMWNTSVLAESALLGWSMRWLPGAAVYNLLWIANWLCACLLGDALLRDLGVRRWLAAAGGLLYGMMPYFTSQTLFHLHLWLTSVPLGLTLVLLRGIRQRPRHPWRYGMAIGGLAALQMYTSLEVAATYALVAGIAALFTLITLQSRVRDVFPVSGRLVLSAILTTAILALPGLVALMHGPGRPAGKLLPAQAYVNDLFTFFVPTPVYALHNAWSTALSLAYTGNFWENDGYLGPAALLWIALAAIRLWRLPCARAALYTFLLVTLLSMGPTLHFAGWVTPLRLPWSLLEGVPFLESALPSRLMLYADGIAIALGVFALEVHLRKSRRRTSAHLLSFATLALVAATWWPVTPYYHSATPDAARAL